MLEEYHFVENRATGDPLACDFAQLFDESMNLDNDIMSDFGVSVDDCLDLAAGFDFTDDIVDDDAPKLKRSRSFPKERKEPVEEPGPKSESTPTPPPSPSRSLSPVNKVKKQSRTASSDSSTESPKWKSWSHEEKTFLVGAVVDRFFRIGSLSSRKSADSDGDCWNFIKATYDAYWDKYTSHTGIERPCERTAAALSRHYKVMKAKISSNDQKGITRYTFREFYKDFELIYNKINPMFESAKSLHRASSFSVGSRTKALESKKRKARRSSATYKPFDEFPSQLRHQLKSEATAKQTSSM